MTTPGAMLSRSPHDEFLELRAVSTSGQLTEEERKRLQKHLAICPSCWEAMEQYEAVAGETFSALVADPKGIESDPSWSQEQAEAALFERMDLEEFSELADDKTASTFGKTPPASQAIWRNVWTLGAASLLLLAALGISAYHVRIRRTVYPGSVSAAPEAFDRTALQRRISDTGHEREILRSQIAERDRQIVTIFK